MEIVPSSFNYATGNKYLVNGAMELKIKQLCFGVFLVRQP